MYYFDITDISKNEVHRMTFLVEKQRAKGWADLRLVYLETVGAQMTKQLPIDYNNAVFRGRSKRINGCASYCICWPAIEPGVCIGLHAAPERVPLTRENSTAIQFFGPNL